MQKIQAFNHPTMLILISHPGKDVDDLQRSRTSLSQRSDQKSLLREFGKLSNDQLLRDEGIMLVTVDANDDQMLLARMGVSTK
jgi:hypothetical protein